MLSYSRGPLAILSHEGHNKREKASNSVHLELAFSIPLCSLWDQMAFSLYYGTHQLHAFSHSDTGGDSLA